jgi:pimeloyl-ACP methyl ester carboxylesterase
MLAGGIASGWLRVDEAGVSLGLLPTATLRPTRTPRPSPTPFPTPAPTQPYTPAFTPAACLFEVPAGARVECGFVTVPEDRRGDPHDVIHLAVAIYRSSSDHPAPDPLIYLQGGPGGDSLAWSAGYYATFIAPLAGDRDVIVFDQRGAGQSSPALDCLDANRVYVEWYLDMPTSEREARYTQALLGCRDRLSRQGVNLAAYTSEASAADVRDIAAALGYKQVDLYGISYGARLAQHVMRDHPGIIRSVILDSAMPVDIHLYRRGWNAGLEDPAQVFGLIFAPLVLADPEMRSEIADLWAPQSSKSSRIQKVFDDCRADAACQAAYPDLQAAYQELSERLNTEPLMVNTINPLTDQPAVVSVTGRVLENVLAWALYANYGSVVPQTIDELRSGVTASFEYLLRLPAWGYADNAIGLMVSINCHEVILGIEPGLLASAPVSDATGLSGIYDSDRDMIDVCRQWGAAPFDPRLAAPVVSDIPTLLLVGAYDTATPPQFSRAIAKTLAQAYLIELPGLGHATSVNGGCLLDLALAFLAAPAQSPEAACLSGLADSPGTGFTVPLRAEDIHLEPYRSEEYQLTASIPSGWKAIGSGFFNRLNGSLDPTQIGLQRAAVSAEMWVEFLAENFQGVGLAQQPDFDREYQANGLSWRLYTAEFKGNPLDLAFAEHEGQTYLVALLSKRAEHEMMFEHVFLPVLDSLQPLEESK